MFEYGQFFLFLALVSVAVAVYLQEWVVLENKKTDKCTVIGFKSATTCDGRCAKCSTPVAVEPRGTDTGGTTVCTFPDDSPEQMTCLASEAQQTAFVASAGAILGAAVLAIGLYTGDMAGLLAAAGGVGLVYATIASTTGALTTAATTTQLVGIGCTADYCVNPGVSAGLGILGGLFSLAAAVPVYGGEDGGYY